MNDPNNDKTVYAFPQPVYDPATGLNIVPEIPDDKFLDPPAGGACRIPKSYFTNGEKK